MRILGKKKQTAYIINLNNLIGLRGKKEAKLVEMKTTAKPEVCLCSKSLEHYSAGD